MEYAARARHAAMIPTEQRVPVRGAGYAAKAKARAQMEKERDSAVDLGVAEELSARTRLASKLNKLIDERRLSQTEAARVLGMSQPKVSAIRNYKLQGISLQRLMQALTALGQHVEIVVSPSSPRARARIRVAA